MGGPEPEQVSSSPVIEASDVPKASAEAAPSGPAYEFDPGQQTAEAREKIEQMNSTPGTAAPEQQRTPGVDLPESQHVRDARADAWREREGLPPRGGATAARRGGLRGLVDRLLGR